MKKYIFGLAILASLFVTGCKNDTLPEEVSNIDVVNHVETIEKVAVNSDYISEVESFYDENNDYYMFPMGTISNVPLETPIFFYYGGKGEIEKNFTKTVTTVSQMSKTVQKSVQKRMSSECAFEVSSSLELEDTIKSSVSSKMSGSVSGDNTETETEIYNRFIESSESSQNSMRVVFDERCQAGYYAYLMTATVRVYNILVVNSMTGERGDIITYNELVSIGYSFAYNESNGTLDVDKNQKFTFELPDVEKLPVPKEFIDVNKEYKKIGTVKEFDDINKNLAGKYVLVADLDFNNNQQLPIGDADNKFSGVLKGRGHTIKNFSISEKNSPAGLIACNEGTIENIKIENAFVSISCTAKNALAGIIAGENFGTILKCSVSDSSVNVSAVDNDETEGSSRYTIAGGIAGKMSGGIIKECSVENVSLYGYVKKHDKAWSDGWGEAAFAYIGGIAGEHAGGSVLNNVVKSLARIEGYAEYRSCSVIVPSTTRSKICLGGIIGTQVKNVTFLNNESEVPEELFKTTFNSYNEKSGVDKIEESCCNKNVGYAG